jgi:hypothetical protein
MIVYKSTNSENSANIHLYVGNAHGGEHGAPDVKKFLYKGSCITHSYIPSVDGVPNQR